MDEMWFDNIEPILKRQSDETLITLSRMALEIIEIRIEQKKEDMMVVK